ncbi:MFS transporter [Sagittula stellata]|uniref:MFS transporter n=1 Tax=Sagittula stellata TaxID=52603 RepID=UPI00058F5D35|nr:MFS transporter [Sagittula stellata]
MFLQNRWLVLAIVSSALFLIVIDMTVLYTALPQLTRALQATATEKIWIVNTYPLVTAGLLIGMGGLGDRLGHKPMFLSGLVVFGFASILAAYSPTAAVLIAARALLAVGAAMMMPATLSIIRVTFTDDAERSFAIGIWAAIASGGAALGPVIGGVLLEWFWWGSVFLINIPIALAAFAAGSLMLADKRSARSHPFDLIGSVQVMVGLIGLIFAIKELAKRTPSAILGLVMLGLGVIALTAFAIRQSKSADPLVDFRLFRNTRFSSGVVAALVAAAAMIGVELVFTQRLQLVVGLTPLQAGLAIMPIPLASFFAGPLTGMAMPRIGAIRTMTGSLAIVAVALALLLVTYQGAPWIWLSVTAVMGFGIGAAMTAASSVIMQSAPESRAGMAASIEEVSFELGGALGVAILGSLMTALYTRTMILPDGVPTMAADSIDQAYLAADRLNDAAGDLLRSAAQGAFDQAFAGVILVSAALVTVSAVGIWRMALVTDRRKLQPQV